MYYNGYFIICIFIGAYLGAFVFSWESVGVSMGYAAFPFFVTYLYDVLDRLTEYGLQIEYERDGGDGGCHGLLWMSLDVLDLKMHVG